MIKKDSITYKYLKVFLLVIVLPTFLISIIINNAYMNALLKNSSDRAQQSMEQISIGIENEVRDAMLSQATVMEANEHEILGLVTAWNRSVDQQEEYDLSKQIDGKLNYLYSYRYEVESVIFFFKGGGSYYFRNPMIVNEHSIREMPWYKEAVEGKGKAIVLGNEGGFIYNQKNRNVLALAVSPKLPGNMNDIELVYFCYKTNMFDGIYSGYKINDLGEMVILDEHRNIIYSRNNRLFGKSFLEVDYLRTAYDNKAGSYIETINGKKVFITTYTVDKTNWKIVNILNYQNLTRDITKTMVLAVTVSFGMIILFVIFSILFFRGILNPVNTLVKGMRKVEKGDFDANIEIRGDGEIQNLGRSFNRMVNEIKQLIKERDLKERDRSRAEIEALQSQINPHFISNTLNAIRLMAMIAKADNIKNTTEAFMKLLSASFGKDGPITTIRSEIENLENYVFIMRVRYGDKFDVEFKVDEDILEGNILKLVLQPILENAILHGLSEADNRGLIQIIGNKQEKDILFKVIDNGIGMTSEQIKKLLEEDFRNSKSFSSIGIRNVDRRIKLNHGDPYGLTIDSEYGRYTCVTILLPYIPNVTEESSNV